MIIACPKCKARHDVSARKPGETFDCSCGNVLAAPKKKSAGWIIVLAIIGVCLVPCLIMAAIAIPNFLTYSMRAKASEARVNLAAIRTAELAYFGDHGSLVAAGPVPAGGVARAKQKFVQDDGFKALAWAPEGDVYYQYEVRVTGPKTAVLTARGDVDGNGKLAEYRLDLDADGPRTEITKTPEKEY